MWSLLAQRNKGARGQGGKGGQRGRCTQKGQMVIRNHKARHDGSSRTAEEQGNFCSERQWKREGRERVEGVGRQERGEGGEGAEVATKPQTLSKASKPATNQAGRQSGKAVRKPLSLAVSDTRCPGLELELVPGARCRCRCQCRVRVS